MNQAFPLILLTATINPANNDFVGRKGVENRENDYLKAIRFYRGKGFRAVFIDNSNFSSENILSEFSSDLDFEYLTFQSLSSQLGKGHGEKEIIDFGLENSNFLKDVDFFVKITGRLIIFNIDSILKDIEFNTSEITANFSRNLSWSDTRVMFLTKHFYNNYFSPTANKFLDEKEGIYFEKVFALSIHLFMAEKGTLRFWPEYPFYIGINGQNGKDFNFNFYKRMKYIFFLFLKKWINKQTV